MEERDPEPVFIPDVVKDSISSEHLQTQFVRMLHEVASFVERYNIIVPQVTVKVGPVSITMTMRRIEDKQPDTTDDPKSTVRVLTFFEKVMGVVLGRKS